MRALQLSRNRGAPQGWAQDFMMPATWTVLFDLVVVLAEHSFGSPDDKQIVNQVLQAVALAVMYVSTMAVIASIFMQTVENTIVNGTEQQQPMLRGRGGRGVKLLCRAAIRQWGSKVMHICWPGSGHELSRVHVLCI